MVEQARIDLAPYLERRITTDVGARTVVRDGRTVGYVVAQRQSDEWNTASFERDFLAASAAGRGPGGEDLTVAGHRVIYKVQTDGSGEMVTMKRGIQLNVVSDEPRAVLDQIMAALLMNLS